MQGELLYFCINKRAFFAAKRVFNYLKDAAAFFFSRKRVKTTDFALLPSPLLSLAPNAFSFQPFSVEVRVVKEIKAFTSVLWVG